ncbi:hflK protein [Acidithiobacillus sp. GGI-221]|nr:hflK protein [Acidithiobacillus sp. GGI-221]
MSVDSVQLLEVTPPKVVQPAFADVVKAREDMERTRDEAQAYANAVVPKATGEAAAMVTNAEGYKQQMVDRAKGDSARFTDILQAYQKNPKVVSERMYLRTMQDILSHTPKVIVESKGQPVINLHMPARSPAAVSSPTSSAAEPRRPYLWPRRSHRRSVRWRCRPLCQEPVHEELGLECDHCGIGAGAAGVGKLLFRIHDPDRRGAAIW